MGLHKYITISIMEIEDLKEHEQAMDALAEVIDELFEVSVDVSSFTGNGFIEDISWFDRDEEMKILSLFFPDFTFRLMVDQGGMEYYHDYYRDGKHQNCAGEIVYEEFDESKLK